MTQRRESCTSDRCVKCCTCSSLLDLDLAMSTLLPGRLLCLTLPFGSGQVQMQMAFAQADDSARRFVSVHSWSTAFGGHTGKKWVSDSHCVSCRSCEQDIIVGRCGGIDLDTFCFILLHSVQTLLRRSLGRGGIGGVPFWSILCQILQESNLSV